MLKKFFKWLLIIVVVLIALLVVIGIAANESLPENGETGARADALATKMEKALGAEHWEDIQYVQWDFLDMHHYLWDKHRNLVRVKWDELTVFIKPGTSEGLAFTEGHKHEGENAQTLINKANDYFNNDMFWLVAPLKTFDPGVTRSIVNYEGEERLMVNYSSGGSTPGDSYLWKIDDSGIPLSFKMWTKIIPVGGLETTWEDWHAFGNGVKIAHYREGVGPLKLVMSNVSVGYTMEDMNCERDPFKALIKMN
ncbi:MAG: hypothetical protein AB8B53_04175 [Flavobacteriales bacterium]